MAQSAVPSELLQSRPCSNCKQPNQRRDGYCFTCRQEYKKKYTPKAHMDDLYIFKNTRLPEIKIGRSCDVERRRQELQASQPFYIDILAIIPKAGHLEGNVHKALAAFKVDGAGREWFAVSLERALSEIGKCLDKRELGETLEAYGFEPTS